MKQKIVTSIPVPENRKYSVRFHNTCHLLPLYKYALACESKGRCYTSTHAKEVQCRTQLGRADMERFKIPITITHRHRRLRNVSHATCSYLEAASLRFLSLTIQTSVLISFLFTVTAMNGSGSGIGSS